MPRTGVLRLAGERCEVEQVFPPAERGLRAVAKVLRVHQWMKNLLLFIPLLAGHAFGQIAPWLALALAFLSFSLCASTVYIANDLLDLESDRLHPRKRKRPFASGLVPAWMGVVAAPVLLAVSLALGAGVGGSFLPWLLFYFGVTCAYSWLLKRLVLVDCLTLAMLYTLRVVAGAAAAGIVLSFWLLAFSVFLFLSLAFVKRYAELQVQILRRQAHRPRARLPAPSDAPLVQMLGIASGYAAVLVLSLYLNSDAVLALYRAPEVIWGAVPVILFWISWMWMQAHRGHDARRPAGVRRRDQRQPGWPACCSRPCSRRRAGAAMVAVSSWGRLARAGARRARAVRPGARRQPSCAPAGPAWRCGMGRSYGDVCLNPRRRAVADRAARPLHRLRRRQRRLRCEAGVLPARHPAHGAAARLVPAGHAGHAVRHRRRRHRQRRARQEPPSRRHLRRPCAAPDAAAHRRQRGSTAARTATPTGLPPPSAAWA